MDDIRRARRPGRRVGGAGARAKVAESGHVGETDRSGQVIREKRNRGKGWEAGLLAGATGEGEVA